MEKYTRSDLKNFYEIFNGKYFINNELLNVVKAGFKDLYLKFKYSSIKDIEVSTFLFDYTNIERLRKRSNDVFFEEEGRKIRGKILIDNYKIDDEQMKAVLSNEKYTMLVAGAGSGKSSTIVAKVKYLIKIKNINPNDIICLSLTNQSCLDLKEKLENNYIINVEVLTFHKLGLNILKKSNIEYEVATPNTLEYVVNEYLNYMILDEPYYMNSVLEYLGVEFRNVKFIYNKYKKTKSFDLFKQTIIKFINLFKSNCYKEAMFEYFYYENKKVFDRDLRRKNKNFLDIAYKIYKLYNEELESLGEIDFNDMIMKATNSLNNITLNYKYIIIDEFQDASMSKLMLIKQMIKNNNTKLFVVGDDFQSIYRFTGSNLNVFLDFKFYFKNANILFLKNTYRNSQQLIETTTDFILKNPVQIKKCLISKKVLEFPIKIVYSNNKKETLYKLIDYIGGNILIIGRNNDDINDYLKDEVELKEEFLISDNFKDRKIRYMTAHKSKGLEEDNVIIISLDNELTSFPNKIKDNHELKFVLRKDEKFLYAEERRLFYVALTRTKNNVYLLTSKQNQSSFVYEIKKYKNVEVLDTF